ncbi:MAG: NAD(P)H-hydrate dehydratase [Pseudomonadota bacterium]
MGRLSPALVARLRKPEDAHKYDHGHALVMAGGPGKGGAARLAARAALRIGAGLVSVLCPKDAMAENAAHLTAIMLRPLDRPAALSGILRDRRFNAICMGPGLGVGVETQIAVRTALRAGRGTVLDADALTSFAQAPAALFSELHGATVLTPHEGEFARLFGAAPAANDARAIAVQEAASRAGCTILLKGPETLIAGPGGVRHLSFRGKDASPWLATAGSGDVLAGLITGLLARGFSPEQAAELGAELHAMAARMVGPGLIAEDLPDTIPKVLASLDV